MLILPIKKKWFDMIASGEKKEEYREIKPYYDSRFMNAFGFILVGGQMIYGDAAPEEIRKPWPVPIAFRNGYSKESPEIICKCTLHFGRGKNQENSADFIQCVAFGKAGEFAERYLHKGTKIVLTGRIQTGSYTNKEGQRIYTTDVVAEDQEFAESKNAESGGTYSNQPAPAPQSGNDGFMPAGDDSELPFV